MEKVAVVLVALDRKNLINALRALNYDKVSPYAVLMEGGNGKFLKVTDKIKVQMVSLEYLD